MGMGVHLVGVHLLFIGVHLLFILTVLPYDTCSSDGMVSPLNVGTSDVPGDLWQ